MSYDIDLINKNTKKILQMKNPAYVRGRHHACRVQYKW